MLRQVCILCSSSVSTIESAYLIAFGGDPNSMDLSEQHVVNCANSANGMWSYGCSGGYPEDGYAMTANFKLAIESLVPYGGYTGKALHRNRGSVKHVHNSKCPFCADLQTVMGQVHCVAFPILLFNVPKCISALTVLDWFGLMIGLCIPDVDNDLWLQGPAQLGPAFPIQTQ